MRNILLATALCLGFALSLEAQVVTVTEGRFHKGDNPAWSQASFKDSDWQVLSLEKDWNQQGVSNSRGYGWYRIHVVIPSSLKKGSTNKVLLDLGPIDDTDETWLNGTRVGKTGTNPEDPQGFLEEWDTPRRYVVDPKLIKWDKDNVIAVRVYNGGDPGGFYARPVFIGKPSLEDFVSLSMERQTDQYKAVLHTTLPTRGTVKVVTHDVMTDKVVGEREWNTFLSHRTDVSFIIPTQGSQRVTVTYQDDTFGETLDASVTAPYILTPPAPATPRYNGPMVFGVRPGSPVIFRLAFSGEKPMKYAVEGLPEGVTLDPDKGVLSGSVDKAGDYPLVFIAKNAKGEARAEFTLKVGSQIGLTPPMGWNSWNCWGLSVSQEKVMSSAAALINRGLADYGYAYMNIDDAWEADERTPDGRIVTNAKFPDIKGLADWLHSNGLKMGIYSSPGDLTCGSFLGSLDHEQQDAETWNEWGVDYLKYDWCGYRKVFNPDRDHSVAAYARPYLKMQQYLRQQPRDIFYSLCQYGMADVWTWGHAVDANSWRTTGDITDTWSSLYRIGFEQQVGLHPYAGPGHWNDPDMLVVGKVGWSNNLRDSRLTPDEQYTHISLWSLLAANMLIGCDIAQIDDFTFNLLCNNEVIAVNQDILGHQAHQDVVEDGMQIWSRDLYDGGIAVGIFNLNEASVPVDLAGCLGKIDIENVDTVRDLWRQKDIPMGTYNIPPHGVLYVKVAAGNVTK
ncbi:MAG: putative Ig domain-containing protein [Bacteroidales bacterium]|nr:putative Ig domain-containing protein [Bacteroidales bacterium]